VDLLPIERWLNQASREYLLDGRNEFFFPVTHRESIRSNFAKFEEQIAESGFLRVSNYRKTSEGHVQVSRPSEVALLACDLLKQRPSVPITQRYWDAARKEAQSFDLNGFLREEYNLCLKKAEILPKCVKILEYLRKNREAVKGMYPRQIPHSESTKIIDYEILLLKLHFFAVRQDTPTSADLSEVRSWDVFFQAYGLKRKPYFVQFFASSVSIDDTYLAHNHYGIIDKETCGRFAFPGQKLLILENEESFYALVGKLPGWTIFLGGGKAVSLRHFLAKLFQWEVLYWGDIDKDAYEIYSDVVKIFPTAISIFMDEATLTKHLSLAWPEYPRREPSKKLIPGGLCGIYERVCKEGIRLEQEKLPLNEVLERVNRSLGSVSHNRLECI
jgi:hypothetical protein